MTAPAVSVLVTTYDHAPYVVEALESLRAQSSQDFEVVITDDASTDGTAEVIASWLEQTGYPALFLRNARNRGICANRNTALARSTGRFVCSLSGDDAYEPERIEKQLSFFEPLPQRVAAVYSDATLMNAAGLTSDTSFLDRWLVPEDAPPTGRIFPVLLQHNFLCAPATMVRRSAIEAVGGYDEDLAFEDWDMWLRLSHRFDFVPMLDKVMRYRLLGGSLSRDPARQAAMRASKARLLGKWLQEGLKEEEERTVRDGLWGIGKVQLREREYAAARNTLAHVAAAEKGWRFAYRRVLAFVAHLPFGCHAIHAGGHWVRQVRRTTPVENAPLFPGGQRA